MQINLLNVQQTKMIAFKVNHVQSAQIAYQAHVRIKNANQKQKVNHVSHQMDNVRKIIYVETINVLL